MNKPDSQLMIAYGESIKTMGNGKVGGYLVRFSTEEDPDLLGEFFTAKTYFGPSDGNNADAMFHHGFPMGKALAELADHWFDPIKTRRDDVGIWAEVVLNMADKYESKVYELAESGKLGWSSGAAGHLVRKKANGEILRWPIAEGSLTPTPTEPRNRIVSMKALEAERDRDRHFEMTSQLDECKTIRDVERLLREEWSFSNSVATAFVAKMRKLAQGELEEKARKEAVSTKAGDLLGVLAEMKRTLQAR